MKGEFPFNFVEIISEEERAAIVNTRRITTEDTYDRANKDNNYNRIQDVSITPKRDKVTWNSQDILLINSCSSK